MTKRKLKAKNNTAKSVETKTVKMTLSVKDRFAIKGIMPQKAGILDQLVVRDIVDKVEIMQPERERINLKTLGSQFRWDEKKERAKIVAFSSTEMEFLKAQVTRLDKENAITQALLGLCLKIREE